MKKTDAVRNLVSDEERAKLIFDYEMICRETEIEAENESLDGFRKRIAKIASEPYEKPLKVTKMDIYRANLTNTSTLESIRTNKLQK